MNKRIPIIAGTKLDFNRFIDDKKLDRTEFIYVDSKEKLFGYHGDVVLGYRSYLKEKAVEYAKEYPFIDIKKLKELGL